MSSGITVGKPQPSTGKTVPRDPADELNLQANKEGSRFTIPVFLLGIPCVLCALPITFPIGFIAMPTGPLGWAVFLAVVVSPVLLPLVVYLGFLGALPRRATDLSTADAGEAADSMETTLKVTPPEERARVCKASPRPEVRKMCLSAWVDMTFIREPYVVALDDEDPRIQLWGATRLALRDRDGVHADKLAPVLMRLRRMEDRRYRDRLSEEGLGRFDPDGRTTLTNEPLVDGGRSFMRQASYVHPGGTVRLRVEGWPEHCSFQGWARDVVGAPTELKRGPDGTWTSARDVRAGDMVVELGNAHGPDCKGETRTVTTVSTPESGLPQ